VWTQRLVQLTKADREKVVQFRDDGLTNRAIAKRFNVSDATVSRILDAAGKPAKRGGWGQRVGCHEM
jgi:DNA invertase Pin-like site-specific DNA recombinase